MQSIKDKLSRRIGELFRFAVSGGICFAVDYGIMVAFKELLGVNYLVAAGLGFLVSVVLNYILSVTWTFEGVDRKNKAAMAVFLLTSVIGLGLNELFMWLFVEKAHIHYMFAKIIAVGLVMIWNYVTKRKALNSRALSGKEKGA